MIAPARLLAALPQAARTALLLAQQHDRSVDPAAAWIAHATHTTSSPTRISGYLRAQARRDRRAGGAHGPSSFTNIDDALDLDLGLTAPSDDPADLLEAAQQVGYQPGLAAALAERAPANDSRHLAQREHITRRRAQQLLAQQAAVLAAGQLCLFGGEA